MFYCSIVVALKLCSTSHTMRFKSLSSSFLASLSLSLSLSCPFQQTRMSQTKKAAALILQWLSL